MRKSRTRSALLAAVLLVALTPIARAGASTTLVPNAPVAERHLAFSDDFTNRSIDPEWSTCYAWWPANSTGCTNTGNAFEAEWYQHSQVYQRDGALVLAATKHTTQASVNGQPKTFPFVSGLVQSRRGFAFTYGYVEFRMRLPRGQGMWPAAWLLPVNYTHRSEIDVMEAHGQFHNVVQTTYFDANRNRYFKQTTLPQNLMSGWHTYGLDWGPSDLTWYVDGAAVYSVHVQTPNEPMYLLCNLAVTAKDLGPGRPAAPQRGRLLLDYVRVWQR
jgi:beta-glucanase (GH16 family)